MSNPVADHEESYLLFSPLRASPLAQVIKVYVWKTSSVPTVDPVFAPPLKHWHYKDPPIS